MSFLQGNMVPDIEGAAFLEHEGAMGLLLRELIRFRSVSGNEREMVEFLAARARTDGFECDLWQSDEAELSRLAGTLPPHIPLAGRPTLVLRLRGTGGGQSLIFNAHSDVVDAPPDAAWECDPWSGSCLGERVVGRGACDVKGPLVAAYWALLWLMRSGERLAGDVLLEIVPGEEDCVGLGTLGSVSRGYRADGAIVLEPTEGLPRCASRAGCRFTITTRGRAIHGTVKWLGVDAIELMRSVQGILEELEAEWNDREASRLFAMYPIARPMTVDKIQGGRWQGMVCDSCTLAGYLELLPTDDAGARMEQFREELRTRFLSRYGAIHGADIQVEFSEIYGGHQTNEGVSLCAAARSVIQGREKGKDDLPGWSGWAGFNAGCEAGVRAALHGTPTLVWGPGSLAHAHAANEHVTLGSIRQAAADFSRLAQLWCRETEHT